MDPFGFNPEMLKVRGRQRCFSGGFRRGKGEFFFPFLGVLVALFALQACSRTERSAPQGGQASAQPAMPAFALEGGEFQRFFVSGNDLNCPDLAKGDCASSLELMADGTLRINPWGKPGTDLVEVRLKPAGMAAALKTLGDPALITLLSKSKACSESKDSETMWLQIGSRKRKASTGYCNQAALLAARATLTRLMTEHFPGQSLSSPPF